MTGGLDSISTSTNVETDCIIYMSLLNYCIDSNLGQSLR
jgi:hypothetical protein